MSQKEKFKPCAHCGAEMTSLSDLVQHTCPRERSIELDCPPGSPRPDAYIEGVVEGLGLTVKETTMRFFGNWKWEFPEVSWERWLEIQPTLKERIQKLYKSGAIRYASW